MLTSVFNAVTDRLFDFMDNRLPKVANFLDRLCDYAETHPEEMSAAKKGGMIGLAVANPVMAGFYLGFKCTPK